MSDDRIQREIEDILNRLDDFVPEEGAASKMRRRSSDAAAGVLRALFRPFAAISLRQVMLTALILIVVAFFGMRIHPLFARWVLIGAVILFFTAFALSFFGKGSAPATQQRWRSQSMELQGPSWSDRLRSWLEAKRRPPYR